MLASLAIQVDCKLLISLNIKTLVHFCHHFHPGRLQTSPLIWIRILVHLWGLLSVHVLSVNGDPAIMLAQKAVGDIICWAWWCWCAWQFIILGFLLDFYLFFFALLLVIIKTAHWYFYVKVIWHRKLSFVTVECGPVVARLILCCLNIGEDFGARLELRLVLCNIKLLLVNAAPLWPSSTWSTVRCWFKRI